jgi:hypothetical protein
MKPWPALVGAMLLPMAACMAKPDPHSAYIGKLVMVGVTLVDHKGTLVKRVQAHGVIKAIEADAGIILSLSDPSKPFLLPPVLTSLRAVAPGTYRERSTGDLVLNPDYATVWQAEADEGQASGVLDWTRGMTWSRPLDFDFPGDNWAAEREN